jgi:hypothetical protein
MENPRWGQIYFLVSNGFPGQSIDLDVNKSVPDLAVPDLADLEAAAPDLEACGGLKAGTDLFIHPRRFS